MISFFGMGIDILIKEKNTAIKVKHEGNVTSVGVGLVAELIGVLLKQGRYDHTGGISG